MKTLYLECAMGAAGDMLMAALLELVEDSGGFIDRLNALGIPGVEVRCERTTRQAVAGTHVSVSVGGRHEHDHNHGHDIHSGHERGHSHEHSTLEDIHNLVERLPLSVGVKRNVKDIYTMIAGAEGEVHGKSPGLVHFHELGAMDAVADIIGVCMLMEQLAPDRVTASPVNVGYGTVRCAHGLLEVPAPATALLLRGVPVYAGDVEGELCTPTGAALIKYFSNDFGEMPPMTIESVGYGMGSRDFEKPNCVRAFLGSSEAAGQDAVCELCCNLDDMTPEAIAYAQQLLLERGALDAFTTAIGMKKSRPGVMLTCICRQEAVREMAELMLRHTSTLGVRRRDCRRYTLSRRSETRQTKFGPVKYKVSEGGGVKRSKPEYEDVAAIARREGMSLDEVSCLLED